MQKLAAQIENIIMYNKTRNEGSVEKKKRSYVNKLSARYLTLVDQRINSLFKSIDAKNRSLYEKMMEKKTGLNVSLTFYAFVNGFQITIDPFKPLNK